MTRRRPLPGATDSVVDVPGIRVGQVSLRGEAGGPPVTGVTAVVGADGVLGVVDVRGAAPGTRETDALAPLATNERVHAVLLVGRSVFGLAAADGAVRELEARGIGLRLRRPEAATGDGGDLIVPIVAAAVIFDFAQGDPSLRPRAEDGARAVAAALDGPARRPGRGDIGVGSGAWTGGIVGPRRKGGIGHASLVAERPAGRLVVAAAVVVNAAGRVRPAGWAASPGPVPEFDRIVDARGQTTLGVVATNAVLTKPQLGQVAAMAHDGLARSIRPVHSGVDGDAIFALAVPDAPAHPAVEVHRWGPAALSIVGSLAADAVSRAIADAMTRSAGLPREAAGG